jgi:hypothetical protein
MQQTPLWVTITGFVLGPAVVAAFLTSIFNRGLNRQRIELEGAMQTRLNEQRIELEGAMQSKLDKQRMELEEATQTRLNEQKAGLDEATQLRVNKHAAELKFESELRASLVDYVAKQRYGLYRSYLLVFEDGAHASPEKLLELLRKADDEVMEPLRAFAWGARLRSETKNYVYEVHAFLLQAIPRNAQPPSSQTVEKLRKNKDLFAKLRAKAINALDRELETLGQA